MDSKRNDARRFYLQTEYFSFWEQRLRSGYEEPHLVDFIKNLNLKGADRVLEIGSGGGRILSRISPIVSRCVGVDLSKNALKAGTLGIRLPDNVDLVVADASALPFLSSCFDKSFSFSTMFFVPDQVAAIKESARVSMESTVEVENRLSVEGLISILQELGTVAFGFVRKTAGPRFATELAILILGRSRAERLVEYQKTGLVHRSFPVWIWILLSRLRGGEIRILAIWGVQRGVPWWLSSKVIISAQKISAGDING